MNLRFQFNQTLANMINEKNPGINITSQDFTYNFNEVEGYYDYNRQYSIEHNTDTSIPRNAKIKIKATSNTLRFFGSTTLYYDRLDINDVVTDATRDFEILNPNWGPNQSYVAHNSIATMFRDRYAIGIQSSVEIFNSNGQSPIDTTVEAPYTIVCRPDSPYFYGTTTLNLKLMDISKMRDLQEAIDEAILNGLVYTGP